MKLKVLSGDGLRLHGVAYGPGEVIPDVPEPVADQWVAAGDAEEVKSATKARSKYPGAETAGQSRQEGLGTRSWLFMTPSPRLCYQSIRLETSWSKR
jgi:hypothetical protein